jgi:hypothetical protein
LNFIIYVLDPQRSEQYKTIAQKKRDIDAELFMVWIRTDEMRLIIASMFRNNRTLELQNQQTQTPELTQPYTIDINTRYYLIS